MQLHIIFRYLNHFTKFVDAYHILNSNHITADTFKRADELLSSFEYEFEELYGGLIW
jgi:hypothetical protein